MGTTEKGSGRVKEPFRAGKKCTEKGQSCSGVGARKAPDGPHHQTRIEKREDSLPGRFTYRNIVGTKGLR